MNICNLLMINSYGNLTRIVAPGSSKIPSFPLNIKNVRLIVAISLLYQPKR